MYERFSDRARKVMQFANQEAHNLFHEYIGTEHILLGLVKEGNGVASSVLKNLGIDLLKIRQEVEKIVQVGQQMVMIGKLPQTPRAKKVVEYSIEGARNLNRGFRGRGIGTEHILLGLLREQEGIAYQVLASFGLTADKVREEILTLLGHKSEVNKDIEEGKVSKFDNAEQLIASLKVEEKVKFLDAFMELENLSPAPWEAKDDNPECGNWIVLGHDGFPVLVSEHDGECGRLPTEFVALARNAFDVMMKHDPKEAMLWLMDTERWYNDRWYKENVEKKKA